MNNKFRMNKGASGITRVLTIVGFGKTFSIDDVSGIIDNLELPYKFTISRWRCKTVDGTTDVKLLCNGNDIDTISANDSGVTKVVDDDTIYEEFSSITFDTSNSDGTGLTITIEVKEI